MTAPTGRLGRALEELHCIRLMGVSGAMKTRHRDVDWIKDRDGGMHQGPGEVAITTITCAVVSSRDHVGADQSEHADASAHCGIPIAAITASPGCLGRRLIKNPDVGLMGIGCRVSARLRHVMRPECGVAPVDQTPYKIAVAAIAGAVISRMDQEERLGIRRRPPRNWRLAPEQIFSIEANAVRYIPKIHDHCPTEI